MNISGHSTGGDIYRLAARLGDVESTFPVAGDKIIYVSPRGRDTNDGLTWGTAKLTVVGGLAALTGPGVIQVGAGIVDTGGQVDLTGRLNVTIAGLGGNTGGAAPATIIRHTGTGATSIINAINSGGCIFRDFQLLYTNALFTGVCIDLRDLAGGANALWVVSNCFVGGGVSNATAAACVAVDNAHSGIIQNCNFFGAVVGVLGRSGAGTFSNAIKILNCHFVSNGTRHISNIGEGWTIDTCTFEALVGGAAGAIINDAAVIARGVSITGCWFGDVIALAGGTQISMVAVGLSITGNYIGGNTGSTCIAVGAASAAGFIAGNRLDAAATGITLGAGVINFTVGRNSLTGVGTPLVSTDTTSEQNRPLTDSTISYRWQNTGGGDVMIINTINGRVGISSGGAPASILHVGGAVQTAYRLSAGTAGVITIAASDSVIAGDATAGALAATLPSAIGCAGRLYTILKSDASINAVTVNTTGGQTINGAATVVLAVQYAVTRVVSNGANWYVV